MTLIEMIHTTISSTYLVMIWFTTRPASQRRCNILHPKKQEILSLQIFRFGYRCSNFNHDHLAPIKWYYLYWLCSEGNPRFPDPPVQAGSFYFFGSDTSGNLASHLVDCLFQGPFVVLGMATSLSQLLKLIRNSMSVWYFSPKIVSAR